jgi:hypothetical protein
LIDALRRIVDTSDLIGCIGIIVDAKDQDAQQFYEKYDFVTVQSDNRPRRMFMAVEVAKAAFAE